MQLPVQPMVPICWPRVTDWPEPDEDRRLVGVEGDHAVAVVDEDAVAVPAAAATDDGAGVGGVDRRARGVGDVDAGVDVVTPVLAEHAGDRARRRARPARRRWAGCRRSRPGPTGAWDACARAARMAASSSARASASASTSAMRASRAFSSRCCSAWVAWYSSSRACDLGPLDLDRPGRGHRPGLGVDQVDLEAAEAVQHVAVAGGDGGQHGLAAGGRGQVTGVHHRQRRIRVHVEVDGVLVGLVAEIDDLGPHLDDGGLGGTDLGPGHLEALLGLTLGRLLLADPVLVASRAASSSAWSACRTSSCSSSWSCCSSTSSRSSALWAHTGAAAASATIARAMAVMRWRRKGMDPRAAGCQDG